jgi:putative membrane protein
MRLRPQAIGVFLTLAISAGLPPAYGSSKDFNSHVASEIHEINRMEIEMGKTAQSKGTISDVQDFARKLVTDHSSADSELMKIASEESLTLQKPEPRNKDEYKLEADTQNLMHQLRMNTGTEFDRAYLEGMKSEHKAVIALMGKLQNNMYTSRLKDFISTKLMPYLRQHQDIASNLERHTAFA